MTHQETDRQLLARYARDRTPAAFEELVRRHAGMVYGAARRWAADPHRADEIAQGVFLLLAQKAGHRGWHDDVGGWLYRAVGYAGRTLRRQEHRRQKRETEVARMNREATAPAESSWQDIAPLVDDAISTLSRPDADAIRLRYLQGLDGPTVAQRLGVTEAAARKRISRALDRLRDVLASRGVIASTTSIAGMLDAHGTAHASAELVARITAALNTGTSAGATAVAGGVKNGFALARAKVATAICAAAVTLGVAGVAITNGRPKDAAATTQPAALDPTTVAQFERAARTVKSLHFVASDPNDHAMKMEGWIEQGRRALLVQQQGTTTTTTLAVGNEKWRYADGGQLIGKGEADPAREYDLTRELEWYRIPRASIRREQASDRKQGGRTLRAYAVETEGGRQSRVVWVDDRMLPALIEGRSVGGRPSHATVTMEWDVPGPESRFEPPKGPVMDVAAELDKASAPNQSWPKVEQAGNLLAVHRVTEGEGRLLYVVYSNRLTDDVRKAVGRLNPAGATLYQYVSGPGGRVGDDLGYIALPLARVQERDIVMQWCVLVPKGGTKLWDSDGLRLSFLAYSADPTTKAPRQVNIVLNVPVAEPAPGTPPPPLAQFAGEAYDAARRWEPLAEDARIDVVIERHTTSGRAASTLTRDEFVQGVEREVRSWQAEVADPTPRRTARSPR